MANLIVTVLGIAITAAVVFAVDRITGAGRPESRQWREHPQRVRFSRGWVAFGIAMVVAGLVTPWIAPPESAAQAVMTVGVVIAVGLVVLAYAFRWYLEVYSDHLVTRGIIGGERTVRYSEIVSYSFGGLPFAPLVRVRTADGTRFEVNYRQFDVTPLLRAIGHHEVLGTWPQPGEGEE